MSTLSSLTRPAPSPATVEREGQSAAVSRRRMLEQAGALAGAAAALGGGRLAAAAGDAATLEIDMACDGATFALNRRDVPGATISPGDTFLVSGRIYPDGTIAQRLSGRRQPGSIGAWIHRGWFYYGFDEIVAGAVPHIVSTQQFLFDSFDGLITEGTEGGQFVVRPTTGGYGMYRGARDVSTETEAGENETVVDLGNGIFIPAPNLRFAFEFDL